MLASGFFCPSVWPEEEEVAGGEKRGKRNQALAFAISVAYGSSGLPKLKVPLSGEGGRKRGRWAGNVSIGTCPSGPSRT